MRQIEISEADEGQRLDRYLRKFFPSAGLASIYKLARTGKIKLDGKRVDNEHRLEAGSQLCIYLSDDQIAQYQVIAPVVEIPKNTGLDFSKWIIYEDESILAINKPAKMNVHPGDHKTTEVSIIQFAHDYFGGKYSSPMFTPSLVHRIDRDTTGVLLIAKDRHGLNFLLDELQNHRMEKRYLAIVAGKLQGKETIKAPLLRVENAKNESKVRVDPQGQKAITHYSSLGSGPKISLVQAELETGRMHQIRVHLASIGHPILGDNAYGNKALNREFQLRGEAARQMLHARELVFTHPKTRKKMVVTAPIPADMQTIISSYLPGLEALEAL